MKTYFNLYKSILFAALLLLAAGSQAQTVTYLWSNGATTPNILVNPQETTTYYLTITQDGVEYFDSLVVTVTPPPVVAINGNSTVCLGFSTTLQASPGVTYLWSTGDTTASITVSPSVNTTYSVEITDANGCTGTAEINVVVSEPAVFFDVQQSCGPFTWIDGVTYTSSTNTPTFTIPGGSVAGCDSIIALDLTINNSFSATDVQSACGSFTWIDGVTYTSSTNTPTFTIPGVTIYGCDSVVTLNLIINQPSASTVNATITEGETYSFNGQNLTTAGTYTATLQNAAGCDSVVTLNLSVNEITNPISCSISGNSQAVCSGESNILTVNFEGGNGNIANNVPVENPLFSGDGQWTYNSGNPNIDVYSWSYGRPGVLVFGDSTQQFGSLSAVVHRYGGPSAGVSAGIAMGVKRNTFGDTNPFNGPGCYYLQLNPGSIELLTGIGNTPSGYWPGWNGVASANLASDIMEGYNTLKLEITPNYQIKGYLNDELLITYTIPDGSNLSGRFGLVAANRGFGFSEIEANYQSNSILWSTGETTPSISVSPTETSTYSVTVTQGNQTCTSEVTITVNQPSAISETATACNSYNWNGSAYTQSGTYTWTGTNSAGCDSVVTLNLTITPQPEQPQLACWEAATFNANTCAWVVSGAQPEQPTNLACYETALFVDTLCNWVVTGTPAPAIVTNASACVSYTWEANGETYSTSGQYSFNSNCQEFTLNLTISNQPEQPAIACWQTATFNAASCSWEISGTQPVEPTDLACWETATFNANACAWVVSGAQPEQPTNLACYETALFVDTLCNWVVTGTPAPAIVSNASACVSYTWEANGETYSTTGQYSFNSNCQEFVLNLTIDGQPEQPQLACWQTATFDAASCSWVIGGTQPAEPTDLACWQTATFDAASCSWVIGGTQPAEPTDLACWETATFNSNACAWVVTGTQPEQPTNLACYETALFVDTLCNWVVTGTPAPAIVTNASACVSYTWEANGETYSTSGQYSFNSNCQEFVLNLTIDGQPEQPQLACWQTATFDAASCSWVIAGTQPAEPTDLACWETATFNSNACAWVVSGTQPEQPTNLACYETALFVDTLCNWVVTGTPAPAIVTNASACVSYTWEANGETYSTSGQYSFNSNCQEFVLNLTIDGQPEQPQLACWQTATFDAASCSWVIGGTQPAEPTDLACWQTATFDAASCSWVIGGTQPAEPTDLACWETATFNSNACAWVVSGTQPEQPTNLACYETALFVDTLCNWVVTGTPAPAIVTNASACVSYTWEANGETYSTTGQYSFNSNCEEYTLNLTINQPSTSSVNATITEGETYSFNGQNLITAGTYTATLQNAAGCDSVVTLNLTVNPAPVGGCYAATVVSFEQGTRRDGTPVAAVRSNINLALGMPETVVNNVVNFVSLGFGGSITLAFEAPIANGPGADIRIDEATWGNYTCNNYPESADVFASQDGINFVFLGTACHDAEFDLGAISWAQYIRIVDVSNLLSFTSDADGFDVNGVSCLNGAATSFSNDGLVACSAQEIVSYQAGNRKNGSAIPAARRNSNNALGMPQNNNTINFVALGFGGSLVAKFDYVVFNQDGNDIRVVETSYGNPSCNNYPERAIVSVSMDNVSWTELGEICQDGEFDLGNVPYAQFVKIEDASPIGSSRFNGSADGYDVDAVVVLNNGCGMNTARVAQLDNTQTPDTDLQMHAYPNPIEDYTVVRFDGLEKDETFKLEIFDASGRLVRSENISVSISESSYLLPAQELARGLYRMVVSNESGFFTEQLVK